MKIDYIEFFHDELREQKDLYERIMLKVDLIQSERDIENLGMALRLKDWELVELMIENKKSEKSKIEESLKGK